jgi:hypothetical protein
MICKKHKWSNWKSIDVDKILKFIICLTCGETIIKANIKNWKERYEK